MKTPPEVWLLSAFITLGQAAAERGGRAWSLFKASGETNGGPLIPTSEELVQLVKRRTPKGRARRS